MTAARPALLLLLLACALRLRQAWAAGLFPPDFAFGVATAAYQVEGAWNEDGRGPSIWDDFSHLNGKVKNKDNGDVAVDHYHLFKEDIRIMRENGIHHYRFSLSWSRIMPDGRTPNLDGVRFYNTLIDALLAADIEPSVTLYHWDLPSALGDINGWLNPDIVSDFSNYADFVFDKFGDRVGMWLTFNEPWTFCWMGYGTGVHAPGRCSDRGRCFAGDSTVEPYLAAHHVLLAHAEAVDVYRRKYQASQRGRIGMVLNMDHAKPLRSTPEDEAAANRAMVFQLAWFADPLMFGTYPSDMIAVASKRLPAFTAEQASRVKGSVDFFGLNHYSSYYAAEPTGEPTGATWADDRHVNTSYVDVNGDLIGPAADSDWLHVVPTGIRQALVWISARYRYPIIYVFENGVDVPGEDTMHLSERLQDEFRIDFYRGYLEEVLKAIHHDKVIVKGYFAWSLLDNFEWADGYTKHFGLVYVDRTTMVRYPKASLTWYADFIRSHARVDGYTPHAVLVVLLQLAALLMLMCVYIAGKYYMQQCRSGNGRGEYLRQEI